MKKKKIIKAFGERFFVVVFDLSLLLYFIYLKDTVIHTYIHTSIHTLIHFIHKYVNFRPLLHCIY